MKAAIWIAFLLFCAAIAGGYYYHKNVYVKIAAAEAARQEAERVARQEQLKAELEAEAKAKADRAKAEAAARAAAEKSRPPAAPDGGKAGIRPTPAPRAVNPASSAALNKAETLPGEGGKPVDAAREKELSEMRKSLRAAQDQANTEKK